VVLWLLMPALAGAQPPGLSNPAGESRTYLPGDFVHVVVSAPADTSQITAIMPDGTPVTLIQERRTNVWRGIWQVPVNFKRGSYSASLTAVDVQGNVFTGQSDTFDVGELSMITLVGKPSAEAKAAPPKPAISEIITAEAAPATAAGQEELMSLIKKMVAPPAGPAPEMSPATRDLLVARNLAAGKEDLRQGRFSEAAAFFRVVLYLSPEQKEAGALLADTQNRLVEQKKLLDVQNRRLFLLLAVVIFAVVALLAFILFYLIFLLPKKHVVVISTPQPKPLSEKEKRENWYKQTNWKSDPFTVDIVKQIFAGGANLNQDGLKNFLKTRIAEAGGSGTEPFTDSALEKIFNLSKGNPAEALKICGWAVNQAIRHDRFSVTAETVREYETVGLKKILIADDEEIIRTSLDAILRKGGGYETDFATDGEETLNKIKNNMYGGVLLDIEMPKLDGYEILRQVRAAYPELPVIFVTGKGIPQKTIESMTQYNLTGYIEKPFTPGKVLDVIARAINR